MEAGIYRCLRHRNCISLWIEKPIRRNKLNSKIHGQIVIIDGEKYKILHVKHNYNRKNKKLIHGFPCFAIEKVQ